MIGDARRLKVGVIAGPHGVRGAVRVKSFTREPEALGRYGPLSDADGRAIYRLRPTGTAKGAVIARIEGVEDRDAAEALKGTELFLPREALPAPDDPDEFYHADLIGLAAEGEDGARLGTVKALYDFGAGDVLEIALEGGGTAMLPFTREAVPLVDPAGGRVVVAPPAESGAPATRQEEEQR